MKRFLIFFLSLMLLVVPAGCGKDNTVQQPPVQSPQEQQTPDKPAAPQLSGTMKVVATSESYGPLFERFTQQTGVKVDILSMSSGEVLSKLRAEGGSPSADLWFGGGIDAFMSAGEDGLLEPVMVDAADDLADDFKDEQGLWYSKGITVVGFLVNNTLAKELELDIPESWADLVDPQYKGEIIMSNPAVSGTNYAAVNGLLQSMGQEEGWQYFEQLNQNIAYYARRGSDPKNKVIADEFAVGITYLDRTIDALKADYDVTIVYPADGVPWVPEGVAVFKNADNTEAAGYFVEWLFSSDDNLQLLAELDQKNGIKSIKPSLEGLELNYDSDTLLELDLADFGARREEILARFETLMGEKAVTE